MCTYLGVPNIVVGKTMYTQRKDEVTKNRDLPESEQAILRELRADGKLPLLRARVRLLRDAGWTLAAIGRPLEANRSTTRMWELGANPEQFEEARALGAVTAFERPPRGARTITAYTDVPPDKRESLRLLAAQARSVRGWTPEDAPSRVAARQLERELIEYNQSGVPVKRLAEHMGVTHRAVAARIDRARAKASVTA